MSRVLVVEDNPTIRDTLGDLFTVEGYEVELVEHGREACEALERHGAPCAIVLDLMMPVMDGWEFLDWKSRSAYRAVPVMVLTALNVDGDVETLADRYDCAVLPKTGGVPELLDRIARCCS